VEGRKLGLVPLSVKERDVVVINNGKCTLATNGASNRSFDPAAKAAD